MKNEEFKQKITDFNWLAELSGVPVEVIEEIFSGSRRYEIMASLGNLYEPTEEVHEEMSYAAGFTGPYTADDYMLLPEDQRFELIDGYFYHIASPTGLHLMIGGEIHRQIANFIMDNQGKCLPFMAPMDVRLDCDDKTIVQPDVIILCDEEKLKKRIFGAPDFVLEVISPSTKKKDYTIKAHKYINAGVREYWIVDPYQGKLIKYCWEKNYNPMICGLDKPVPIEIYEGRLEISFENIVKWIEKYQ